MAPILILYASTEGHTAKIAHYMAKIVKDVGHQATVIDDKHLSAGLSLQSYAAVIIGASVHMGKYPGSIGSFVKNHLDQLQAKPTGSLGFHVVMITIYINGLRAILLSDCARSL